MTANLATKCVILAAGIGSRMRHAGSVSGLSDEQKAVAGTGVKALIPVGRPFLDYALSRAANAGLTEVCLVIGPSHDQIRRYYAELPRQRLRIAFAVQRQALGTAHALAAAESFVGDDPFLMMNSDNCYPSEALRLLCRMDSPSVVGFDRDALVAKSNLTAKRIAGFAIIQEDERGLLERIVEKPDEDHVRQMKPPVLVGMNCWRFSPRIFESCRAIDRSPRGEFEIPDAVSHSIHKLSERYRVLRSSDAVLDLSRQSDIAAVKQHLAGEKVQL